MMRRSFHNAVWAIAGLVAALLLPGLFRHAYPFTPSDWSISKSDAEALVLERARDLGDVPPGAVAAARLGEDYPLEFELQRRLREGDRQSTLDSPLKDRALFWDVEVFAARQPTSEWLYRGRISASGDLLRLSRRVPDQERGSTVDPEQAVAEAQALLRKEGIDLALYQGPEFRVDERENRTDTRLRFHSVRPELGPDVPTGVEVTFAGQKIAGLQQYADLPKTGMHASLQAPTLMNYMWIFLAILVAPLVGIAFVRRYHAGEIGVARGVRIFLVAFGCSIVLFILTAKGLALEWNFGTLTFRQTIILFVVQLTVIYFLPLSLTSMLSWSVGESLARERGSSRLAAFEALFEADWRNATFARSALRGLAAGLVLLALMFGALILLRPAGVWAASTLSLGPWWPLASWFGVAIVAAKLPYALYVALFGHLLVVTAATRRLGVWPGGAVATLFGAFAFIPLAMVVPFHWNILLWIGISGVLVVIFLRYGVLTSMLTYLTAAVLPGALAFTHASNPSVQFQSLVAMLLLATPLILSVRYLGSRREFEYHYDDVPAHVRRIAERERQKVELETARGIQSAILPQLPPQMNGVQLAHAYLPASEVGGDFYDVLALEDGRLAMAVGDVAGHGVASGLVMSMARSALAVQTTFDPDVGAVFRTLNRLVYQGARRRLLTTLCYALLEPRERHLLYASAGHLFPYRVRSDGGITALESVAYPLGVRPDLLVSERSVELDSGDKVVMFSDGVVETRAPGSDELFGFTRLESVLKRAAKLAPTQLRDAVLEALAEFGGQDARREDDVTLLVVQVP